MDIAKLTVDVEMASKVFVFDGGKYYEITTVTYHSDGATRAYLVKRWGKRGSKGVIKVESFSSVDSVHVAYVMESEKRVKKGYREFKNIEHSLSTFTSKGSALDARAKLVAALDWNITGRVEQIGDMFDTSQFDEIDRANEATLKERRQERKMVAENDRYRDNNQWGVW